MSDVDFSMVELFPESVQRLMLAKILKGRRRIYWVGINGRNVGYPRNVLRDYLKRKFPCQKA